MESADACMYCGLEGGEDPPRRMCHCPSKTHRACLEKALVGSQTDSCPLCGFQFTVQRIPRHGLLRDARYWLWHEAGGGQLVLFLLWAYVLTPAAVVWGHLARMSIIYHHRALAIRQGNLFWRHAVREPGLLNRVLVCSLLLLVLYGAWIAVLVGYNTRLFLAWRRRTSRVSAVDRPAPAAPGAVAARSQCD